MPIVNNMASCPAMGRFAIHSFNLMLLILVLIGVPAATSIRLGNLQIGSRPASELVTLGLLGMAFTVNLAGWLYLGKKPSTRSLWVRWSAFFLILLFAEWSHIQGLLEFGWFQESLLWLKSKL